jgi:hypothetical protein
MHYVIRCNKHTFVEVEMRLGINVPDDLIKRLEPMKPFINISKLCRDVITDYVLLLEKAKKQADNEATDKIINTLFEARKPVVVDWELLGLQDATLWASLAGSDDWDLLFEKLDYYEREGKSPFDARMSIPRVKGAKTHYDRLDEYDVDNGWFEQRINDPTNPYIVAQLNYQRGFLSYIIIVRQKVLEQLKAYIKTKEEKMKQLKSELKMHVDIPKTLQE